MARQDAGAYKINLQWLGAHGLSMFDENYVQITLVKPFVSKRQMIDRLRDCRTPNRQHYKRYNQNKKPKIKKRLE